MKWNWILASVVFVAFTGVLQADTIDSTSGLVYHLTADSGVTASSGAVSAWTDSNSVYTFSQGSASLQPMLVANAVNGHAAVQFNRTNATQLITSSSATVQTLIVVCQTGTMTAGANAAGLWGLPDDHGVRRNSGNNGWYSVNGNDFGYNGSTTINGVSTTSDTTGTWEILVVTAASPLAMSSAKLGLYYTYLTDVRAWSGEIAELATFSGTLTSSQLNSIGYSLAQKYGITTTYTVPEPSTMILVSSGILAVLVLRRRYGSSCVCQ